MKQLALFSALLCLSTSLACAEEQNALEELASRTNMIKPEEYLEMTQPVKESARQTAKKLTPQEIEIMSSAQNRINRNIARKNKQPNPPSIKLSPQNRQELEKFLTPKMETYDDFRFSK